METICPNPACGRPWHDGWTACAFCGRRGPVAATERVCDHDFEVVGPCCYRCGFNPEFGGRAERTARNVLSVVACVAGVGMVGAGMTTLTSGAHNIGRSTGKMFGVLVVLGVMLFGLGVNRFRLPSKRDIDG